MYFGKQLAHNVFECFGYSLEKCFCVFMLGLAMDFNACLMGFKIIM